MEYKKAFTYVFEDPDWIRKYVIGALFSIFSFLIIPFFFAAGYRIEVIQNRIFNRTPALPEWDRWGEKFIKGLKLALILVIYYLPFLITLLAGAGGIILAITQKGSSETTLVIIGIIIAAVGFVLAFLYGLFVWLIIPAIFIKFAATEKFGEAFKLGEIFKFIRGSIGSYLLVIALQWGFGIFLGQLGQACCLFYIVVLAVGFYSQLFSAHLYGQLYLESQKATTEGL